MFLENLDSCTSFSFELFIYRYLLCKDIEGEKKHQQKRKKNPDPVSDILNAN